MTDKPQIPPLKLCPFCGEVPKPEHWDSYFNTYCANEKCLVNPATGAKTQRESDANWNTRPASIPGPSDEAVGLLKDAAEFVREYVRIETSCACTGRRVCSMCDKRSRATALLSRIDSAPAVKSDLLLCDGCNVRGDWEHRCHEGPRIAVRGVSTVAECQCQECCGECIMLATYPREHRTCEVHGKKSKAAQGEADE